MNIPMNIPSKIICYLALLLVLFAGKSEAFTPEFATIDLEYEEVAVVCDPCRSNNDFEVAVKVAGANYPAGFYSVFTGSTETGKLLRGTLVIMDGWPTRTIDVYLSSATNAQKEAWEDAIVYLEDYEPVIQLPGDNFSTVLDDFNEPDLLAFLNGHPSIRGVSDARRTGLGLARNFALLIGAITPNYVVVVWPDGSRAVYAVLCGVGCVSGIGTLSLVEDSAVDAEGNPVNTEAGNDGSNAPRVGNFGGNLGFFVPPPNSSSCYFCQENGTCMKVSDELCEDD